MYVFKVKHETSNENQSLSKQTYLGSPHTSEICRIWHLKLGLKAYYIKKRLQDTRSNPRSPKKIMGHYDVSTWITKILTTGRGATVKHLLPGAGSDGGQTARHWRIDCISFARQNKVSLFHVPLPQEKKFTLWAWLRL